MSTTIVEYVHGSEMFSYKLHLLQTMLKLLLGGSQNIFRKAKKMVQAGANTNLDWPEMKMKVLVTECEKLCLIADAQ